MGKGLSYLRIWFICIEIKWLWIDNGLWFCVEKDYSDIGMIFF